MNLTRKICVLALGGVATSSASAFVASTFRAENKEPEVTKEQEKPKSAGYLEWGPNKGLGKGNGDCCKEEKGQDMDIF